MLNSILLIFGSFGAPEVIIILVIILLLFGGKKIPELMKGLGKGVKSFKEGMNEVEEQINQADPAKPLAKPEDAPKTDGTTKTE